MKAVQLLGLWGLWRRLVGTLEAPSVQGHELLPLQELWPYQSLFFKPLAVGDQKASLAFLCSSAHSGT